MIGGHDTEADASRAQPMLVVSLLLVGLKPGARFAALPLAFIHDMSPSNPNTQPLPNWAL